MTIFSLKDFYGNYTGFFSGTIDELRFWNYKLTPQEIIDYSFEPLNGNKTGLIAYFDMEDYSIGTNLTITNKATISGDIVDIAYGSSTSPSFTSSCSPNIQCLIADILNQNLSNDENILIF